MINKQTITNIYNNIDKDLLNIDYLNHYDKSDSTYIEKAEGVILDILEYIGYDESIGFDIDGKNSNSNYYTDLATEWADSQCDIYFTDLYKSCNLFSDYINDAVSEGLVDIKNFELRKAIQAGQCKYYNELAYAVMNAI